MKNSFPVVKKTFFQVGFGFLKIRLRDRICLKKLTVFSFKLHIILCMAKKHILVCLFSRKSPILCFSGRDKNYFFGGGLSTNYIFFFNFFMFFRDE